MNAWRIILLVGISLLGRTVQAAPENWPRRYNAGVLAYQTNDFTAAAQAFEQALSSADRALQARAFYNLGNTAYRLGQAEPAQAQEHWKRALERYDQALSLDPNDADARFNREFVQKKLEELEKQQQQEQQQQQSQQNQNSPDQNQPDQSQQNQPKQDPAKPDPSQQSSQPQQQQPTQPDQSQPPQPSQPDQQKAGQQQPPPATPEGQARPSNEPFDKQQARALLDQLREQERLWDFHPELQMKDLPDNAQPAKDW